MGGWGGGGGGEKVGPAGALLQAQRLMPCPCPAGRTHRRPPAHTHMLAWVLPPPGSPGRCDCSRAPMSRRLHSPNAQATPGHSPEPATRTHTRVPGGKRSLGLLSSSQQRRCCRAGPCSGGASADLHRGVRWGVGWGGGGRGAATPPLVCFLRASWAPSACTSHQPCSSQPPTLAAFAQQPAITSPHGSAFPCLRSQSRHPPNLKQTEQEEEGSRLGLLWFALPVQRGPALDLVVHTRRPPLLKRQDLSGEFGVASLARQQTGNEVSAGQLKRASSRPTPKYIPTPAPPYPAGKSQPASLGGLQAGVCEGSGWPGLLVDAK